jgi:GrpB-like predicted nucleotidyltransferase (UPF0157 family)
VRPTGHRTNEPVDVVDYDPEWPRQFERLARRARQAVGELAVALEHVGSTAVPGLAAKPIVDLFVLVAAVEDVRPAIERLETIGYRHQGDLGLPGREALAWPAGEPRHHLYVSTADNAIFRRIQALRDHLRSHPADAAAYGTLKRELAGRHRHDRIAYGDGKTEFIGRILATVPTQT